MTAPARSLPPVLKNIKFPVIGSPLFIISNPKLVIAQCKAGVVGSMPALNARPASQLDEWLAEITEALAAYNQAHPDKPAIISEGFSVVDAVFGPVFRYFDTFDAIAGFGFMDGLPRVLRWRRALAAR